MRGRMARKCCCNASSEAGSGEDTWSVFTGQTPEREPSLCQDGSLGGPNDVLALARRIQGDQRRGASGLALLGERQPGCVLAQAGRSQAKHPEGAQGVNGHHASSADDSALLGREGEIRAEVKQVPAQREPQELSQEALADR